MKNPKSAFIIAFLCAGSLLHADLLPEGQFTGREGDRPRGWSIPHPNYLEQIGASVTLRDDGEDMGNTVIIKNTDPTKSVAMQTQIEIDPEWVGKKLIFTCNMMAPEIEAGTESWHNARIALSFEKPGGGRDYPTPLFLDQPVDEWQSLRTEWRIPAGVTQLNIDMGLFFCTGIMVVNNFTVELE